jgi:cytochrome P450
MSTTLTRDVPVMDVDLYSEEMIADPWPTLRRIREAGPVVWNACGHWMSAQDRVCRYIFNHPEVLGAEPAITGFFGREAFIAIDDKAQHNALRNIWAIAFRRDTLQPLAPLIRRITSDLLDPLIERMQAGETVDIAADVCRLIPAYVISHMMGVPEEAQPSVVEWSDAMAKANSGGFGENYAATPEWQAGERAKAELAAFLSEQIRHRRDHPGDDLISQIVHAEVGRTLSEDEIIINTRQLLFAGNETTANWLAHICHILGQRPALRAELDGNRELLPAALEEMLRWEPVVQVMPRNAVGRITLEGVEMEDGASFTMLLGGANRDPARYADPETLDIHREPKASLAFGYGLHSCLGVTLARLEAVATTACLLDKLPAYAIAGPVGWTGFNLRGPSPLPIALA